MTEPKRNANFSIMSSVENLRIFAENLPLLAWTAEPDGWIDYYNQNWYGYTGQSTVQAQGYGWESVHHPDDIERVKRQWDHALRTGALWQSEFRLKRASDQSFRWFLTRAIAIRDEDGKILKWFGTNTDVDDLTVAREVAERELVQARNDAELANRTKSVFLANMSHEIRTPLAAIIGFSNLLLDENQKALEQKKCIGTIKRNSEHLSKLVDEILDLSKIEAGHLEIEPLVFNLNEIIEYVEAIANFKARENGITFRIRRGSYAPKFVETDPTRLRQILLNVVGNAIKFTSRGGVELNIDSEPILEVPGRSRVVFRVTDTGIGVSEEQRSRLFVPFTQSDPSTTRKFGGTGLGLTVSRKLAQAMGGNINLITSEVGVGSVFEIAICCGIITAKSDLKASRRAEEILAAERTPMRGLRILVVEDTPDLRELLVRILTKLEAQVTIATNGTEGIERAMAGDFDVVLMDIQMPGIDGYEATRELRKRAYRKPIIALTAHAMKEDRELAFQAGFDDHLTKPVQRTSLIDVISHYAAKLKKSSLGSVRADS